MLDNIWGSILDTTAVISSFSIVDFMLCTFCSLALGLVVAGTYMYKNNYNKGFVTTLSLLPAIVQMVIMLVNGNLGTGVAVMGAFSLIRFRSAPGGAREICSIFLAMAIGLATGTGYLVLAVLFSAILCGISIIYVIIGFGEHDEKHRELKIVIPEDLDYTDVFDDLLKKYTTQSQLYHVKTVNMGSLYKLNYHICLKDVHQEKNFIDELRTRNGNLEIVCGRISTNKEEL